MTGIEYIEARRGAIEELCRKYGVLRLRLFGSALRPTWVAGRSDIDFAADFGPPPAGIDPFLQQFGLIANLEQALGMRVDVVEMKAARNRDFRAAVDTSAVELYAA